MSDKKYFSYVRVSTQRQGQIGTSLTEQQAAIEHFSRSWNLPITRRFEERETAAKQGRPVFLEMLKLLKQRRAHGVIIHKIDRSARNLKDWADLGSLIDSGLEVHFASESLDLSSRGGRLSADIQAVVASDFIRNLREETKKGIYGRLKQGLYPFPAMVGYLNNGKGQPKSIDPVGGPFIRKAFELYSTGDWGLIGLSDKLYETGLRNKRGKKITINGLSTILHNPFYIGVIKIKKTGEMFSGIHSPIVSKQLFDEVQSVFMGKKNEKVKRHFFTYRRTIRCQNCEKYLIAEIQKGNTYYRCRSRSCLRHCLKEESITKELLTLFEQVQMTDQEYNYIKQAAASERERFTGEVETRRKTVIFHQNTIKERLSKLADILVDGVIDKETYLQKKNELVLEEQSLVEELANFELGDELILRRLEEFLELANSAYLSLNHAPDTERRELVKITTANFTSDGKSVSIKLKNPFQMIADRPPFTAGTPYREGTRTVIPWLSQLFKFFVENRH